MAIKTYKPTTPSRRFITVLKERTLRAVNPKNP